MNKIIADKNKLFIISLLILGGLFMGMQPAKAFLDIPFNMAQMQLDSLDFIDSSVLRVLMLLVMLATESTLFLFISANLLDWSSSLPVGLSGNALINSGWGFTSGLVNMLFILVLLAIAFSYIFKFDNFQVKKALPALIAIALLMNFSLLFIKMITDVGWIFQNSFKEAFFSNGSLATVAVDSLKNGAGGLIALITTVIASYLVSAAIPLPFITVGFQILLGTVAISGEFLFGMLSHTIILIIFNFIVGLTFLVYALLFLARIGVIWLLAVIAPVAFAAYILPTTRKLFSQWLNALLQWTFLGVVMFFFMGLGVRLFDVISPAGSMPLPSNLGGWDFLGAYYPYIFLVVYLIVSLSFCKKFVPAGAQAVWGMGEMLLSRGGQLTAGGTRKWGTGLALKREEQAVKAHKRLAELEARGTLTAGGKMAKGWWTVMRGQGTAKNAEERAQMLAKSEARVQMLKGAQIQTKKQELLAKTKNMDEAMTKAFLASEMLKHGAMPERLRDKTKSSALMELSAEKEADDALERGYKTGIYLEGWRNAGPEDFRKNRVKRAVLARRPDWGTYNERKAIREKLKAGDIDKWSTSSKENDTMIKEIVAGLQADLISRLGSQTKNTAKKVQEEIDKTIGEAWRNYPVNINTLTRNQQTKLLQQLKAIRYFHVSPSTESYGWKTYGKLRGTAPDTVENRIEELRRILGH